MKHVTKKLGVGLSLLLLMSTLFSIFSSVQPASAAPGDGLASDYGFTVTNGNIDMTLNDFTLRWVHASSIELQFTKIPNTPPLVFTPATNVFSASRGRIDADGGFIYELEAKDFGCRAWIGFDYYEGTGGSASDENRKIKTELPTSGGKAKVQIEFRSSATGECEQYSNASIKRSGNGLKFQDTNLSIAYFGWTGTGKISTTDGGKPGSFTESSPGSDVFWRDTEGSGTTCRDKLIVDRTQNTVRWFELKNGKFDHNKTPPADAQASSCGMNSNSKPTSDVAWPLVGSESVPSDDVVDAGSPGGTDTSSDTSCESSIDSFLGLFVCPILGGADKLITATEGIIDKKLQVNTEFTSNDGLHEAWTQLARISSGLLVIVALVMIISTALGFDLVSSYTLKKMLPRIVIGAIGIWLSWALATTYIGFMNDLGRGISGLMFEPFKGLYDGITSFSQVNLKYIAGHSFANSDSLTDGTASAVFTGAFILFIVTHGGLFAILSAGLTVAVAMLIGLFLLALREVIIVFLLVMAPVGIAAWMLPNTQKIWKLWSGTFNKLLLLYPLFMGAITAGKIFALISAQSTKTNNGVIEVLIPMIAYVSPFFFLPALFKLAGSAFSNITGMVNDKSKGLTDKWHNGLNSQKEANKKIRKETGLQDARMRLADGKATMRDRARLGFGQVGMGRKAYRLNRERNAVQGYKDMLERSMLENQVARHGAKIQSDNFNPDAEKARLTAAEAKLKTDAATAELSKGKIEGRDVGKISYTDTKGVVHTGEDFDYSNADHLEHIFRTSTSRAVQAAAHSQLVRTKSDKQMRSIQSSTPTLSDDQKGIMQEAKADGSAAEAFFKKAPDLVLGAAAAFKDIPAPQATVDWSAETWELAIGAAVGRHNGDSIRYQRMLSESPEATSSLNSTKKQAIERALGLRSSAKNSAGDYIDVANDERVSYARQVVK